MEPQAPDWNEHNTELTPRKGDGCRLTWGTSKTTEQGQQGNSFRNYYSADQCRVDRPLVTFNCQTRLAKTLLVIRILSGQKGGRNPSYMTCEKRKPTKHYNQINKISLSFTDRFFLIHILFP